MTTTRNELVTWYDRLSLVVRPDNETLADLGDSVVRYLKRYADHYPTDVELDGIQRICNYWSVKRPWLEEWRTIYEELEAEGHGAELIWWLEHPTKDDEVDPGNSIPDQTRRTL